jgi:hypothetical protein
LPFASQFFNLIRTQNSRLLYNDDSKQSDGGMREDQLQQEPEPESKANEGNQGGASSLVKQPAMPSPTYAWCDYPVVQNVSVHNVALRELKQI